MRRYLKAILIAGAVVASGFCVFLLDYTSVSIDILDEHGAFALRALSLPNGFLLCILAMVGLVRTPTLMDQIGLASSGLLAAICVFLQLQTPFQMVVQNSDWLRTAHAIQMFAWSASTVIGLVWLLFELLRLRQDGPSLSETAP